MIVRIITTIFQIKTQDYNVAGGTDGQDTVSVDSSFNEKLRFTLTWTGAFTTTAGVVATNCNLMDLQVTSPDGAAIGQGDPGYEKDDEFSFIYIYSANHQVLPVSCSPL